jgi:hypothetical protein
VLQDYLKSVSACGSHHLHGWWALTNVAVVAEINSCWVTALVSGCRRACNLIAGTALASCCRATVALLGARGCNGTAAE